MNVINNIPIKLIIVVLLYLVVTLIVSPNFLISIPVFFYIPFVYYLFFKKESTNVLFWGQVYQWLSVSIQLFYCNFIGISLKEYYSDTVFPADLMEYAVFLSSIGLYVFSFGIHTVVKSKKMNSIGNSFRDYDPWKLLQTYIIVSLLINLTKVAIWSFPTIVQIFYFLFYIKWGFFVVTFISIFRFAPNLKLYLIAVIIFEFFLGLSAFFASEFSNILIFSIVAFIASARKINFWKASIFLLFSVFIMNVAIIWTVVKGEYRTFLNKGEVSQNVLVSDDEARGKLVRLIGDVDKVKYQKAFEDVVSRIGYIQYFAACLNHVPAIVSHENGSVYSTAIGHFLVPRFLYPNKRVLDDSKHTMKYTGLNLSGVQEATSFSLGSFADAYVDFGNIIMFIPIFLFGYVIGFFYRSLYQRANSVVWSIILTSPFLLLVNVYGADTTKAFGFLFIYFVVITLIANSLMRLLNPIILSKRNS